VYRVTISFEQWLVYVSKQMQLVRCFLSSIYFAACYTQQLIIRNIINVSVLDHFPVIRFEVFTIIYVHYFSGLYQPIILEEVSNHMKEPDCV
jgi:hypothetical protein